jgi:hypothetical protein
MKNKKTKVLAQMKSSHYYIFWGICTVAVVVGQIYVGTGYRQMADEVGRIGSFFEKIENSLERLDGII